MSIWTGDTGGNGTAFGPLNWNTNNPGSTGTFYLFPSEGAPDTGEYVFIVAGTGTYTTLQIASTNALSTDSLTFTVRKGSGAGAQTDTALVAVLAAGATDVTASGSVSVVAGDRISVKVVQSGSNAVVPRIGVGLY